MIKEELEKGIEENHKKFIKTCDEIHQQRVKEMQERNEQMKKEIADAIADKFC